MIVWLASYPRSGNTLLRTILKATMNQNSYFDEEVNSKVGWTAGEEGLFGHISRDVSFDDFYIKAKNSKELFLIKTHLPPKDQSPVIYIVRDGRSALWSYFQYHRNFIPDAPLSIIELILGLDFYGGWSEHYRTWMCSDRKKLVLRYEELAGNLGREKLESIAKFLDYSGNLKAWVNPFIELKKGRPNFFRNGDADWVPPNDWTKRINEIFFFIHGKLMDELGYIPHSACDHEALSLEDRYLVDIIISGVKKQKEYEKICLDRLKVINILDEELKRLKGLSN
jgi:hypothetical protein